MFILVCRSAVAAQCSTASSCCPCVCGPPHSDLVAGPAAYSQPPPPPAAQPGEPLAYDSAGKDLSGKGKKKAPAVRNSDAARQDDDSDSNDAQRRKTRRDRSRSRGNCGSSRNSGNDGNKFMEAIDAIPPEVAGAGRPPEHLGDSDQLSVVESIGPRGRCQAKLLADRASNLEKAWVRLRASVRSIFVRLPLRIGGRPRGHVG